MVGECPDESGAGFGDRDLPEGSCRGGADAGCVAGNGVQQNRKGPRLADIGRVFQRGASNGFVLIAAAIEHGFRARRITEVAGNADSRFSSPRIAVAEQRTNSRFHLRMTE